MNKEIWKDIKGYEELYAISSLGRVKNLKTGRLRVLQRDKDGYLCITLSGVGKLKGFKVHRLVAQAFIPNYDNKPTVNHIDGNKENNFLCNLEWSTYSENNIHAISSGLRGSSMFFDSESIKEVLNLRKEGYSYKEIASIFKINEKTVRRNLKYHL